MSMNTAAIKSQLHKYIDQADNEHLAAIYVLLKKEIDEQYEYDADTLEMLYKRMEEDLKGSSRSYTVQEAFSLIRNSRNK